MKQEKSRTYTDCAVLSAKWGVGLSAVILVAWAIYIGLIGVLQAGEGFATIKAVFSGIILPRLGIALQDALIFFVIAFTITAGRLAWSRRTAASAQS